MWRRQMEARLLLKNIHAQFHNCQRSNDLAWVWLRHLMARGGKNSIMPQTLSQTVSSARSSSILTIFVPPLRKIVTAFEFLHFSMTSILSLVVPNVISRTSPALPSLSPVSSWNRGTMRPPVAMAMSSISGPPTHLKEGKH